MTDHRNQAVEPSVACIQIALDEDRAYVEHGIFRITLTATFTVSGEVDIVLFKISERGKAVEVYRDENAAIRDFLRRVDSGRIDNGKT